MVRQWLMAGTILLGTSAAVRAQVPTTGTSPVPTITSPATGTGTGGAGGAAGEGKLAEEVKVCKSCCSVWDFMGVKGAGKILKGIGRTRLAQALLPYVTPLARVTGLGPSVLSDKFAKSDNPAMQAANKSAKAKAEAGAKVQAARALAKEDCKCNPDVIPALLALLDDCNEIVRYEALKALRNQYKKGKEPGHPVSLVEKLHGKDCGPEDPCGWKGCQCEVRVLNRLNSLLRERYEDGCVKEQSPRIRDLAETMIQDCLSKMQPPPREEPKPEVKPEPSAKPGPKAEPTGTKRASAESVEAAVETANVASYEQPAVVAEPPASQPPDYFAIGNQHFDTGAYRAAIDAYTEAINADPTSPDLYTARSVAYTNAGDSAKAQADARKAMELSSANKTSTAKSAKVETVPSAKPVKVATIPTAKRTSIFQRSVSR